MTAKIVVPTQRHQAAPSFSQPWASCPPNSSEFAELLDSFRGPHQIAEDFLGQAGTARNSAAKLFNADGFFEELQAALERKIPDHKARSGVPAPSADQPSPETPFQLSLGEANLRSERTADEAVRRPGTLRSQTPNLAEILPVAAKVNSATGITSFAEVSLPLETESLVAAEAACPAKAGEQSAGVTVRCDGSSIFIAGALGQLSEEERTRLIEQIGDLLVEHGLTLSSIWLNGRHLAPASKGKS